MIVLSDLVEHHHDRTEKPSPQIGGSIRTVQAQHPKVYQGLQDICRSLPLFRFSSSLNVSQTSTCGVHFRSCIWHPKVATGAILWIGMTWENCLLLSSVFGQYSWYLEQCGWSVTETYLSSRFEMFHWQSFQHFLCTSISSRYVLHIRPMAIFCARQSTGLWAYTCHSASLCFKLILLNFEVYGSNSRDLFMMTPAANRMKPSQEQVYSKDGKDFRGWENLTASSLLACLHRWDHTPSWSRSILIQDSWSWHLYSMPRHQHCKEIGRVMGRSLTQKARHSVASLYHG